MHLQNEKRGADDKNGDGDEDHCDDGDCDDDDYYH